MEMYKIVRMSVFAWITILIFMLMLDTLGISLFSRHVSVYAVDVSGAPSSVKVEHKIEKRFLQDLSESEEYEEEGEDDEEFKPEKVKTVRPSKKGTKFDGKANFAGGNKKPLAKIKTKQAKEFESEEQQICNDIVCHDDEYCFIPEPGRAQCLKKASLPLQDRHPKNVDGRGSEFEDDEDSNDSDSSDQEEDDDEADELKERQSDKEQKEKYRKLMMVLKLPAEKEYYNNSRIIQCPSCPIGHGQMLCGSDNATYSSMCRLEFHNCIHQTLVKFSCFGYCPCMKVYEKVMLPLPASALEAQMKHKAAVAKQKATEEKNKNLKAQYYNEKKMRIKLKKDPAPGNGKASEHNQALPKKELDKFYYAVEDIEDNTKISPKTLKKKLPPASKSTKPAKSAFGATCGSEQLRSMGLRLLDWFAVVMGEEIKLAAKVAKSPNKTKTTRGVSSNLSKDKLLPNCERAVSFMFHHFDGNNDYRLSFKELYYLEHDENEHCLEPYLGACDEDANGFLTAYEWCACFNLRLQPCSYHVKHLKKGQVGTFVPQCTEAGQYRPVQCHASTGVCWCADRNGNEIAGTRVRGRYPTCAKSYPVRKVATKSGGGTSGLKQPYQIEEFEDDEDLELDSFEDGRGSGEGGKHF